MIVGQGDPAMTIASWMILAFYQATLFVVLANAGCPMRPTPTQTSAQRTSGDGGYGIMISGRNDKYVPNTIYAIALRGSSPTETVEKFRRFTLSVDSQHAPNSPISRVGSLQLYTDSLTEFNEDCVNTVSEATDHPKSEIQVMWRSPPAGSGCVVFTAMVFLNPNVWYAEDGGLVKTFCEAKPDEYEGRDSSATCCACDEAKYSLVLEGIWSNVTHPKDFPFSAWLTHFSDLIGGTHETDFSFWGRDSIATDGFRQLAEWGSASGLESELRANAKHLKTLVKAAGLWYPNVNANTSANFRVDKKHPLLSVVSMLGPSPDWVVGVSKFNLCQQDCTWMSRATIDLYPWDAGTDNGISYMSPNSETKPREKMKPITTTYPEDPRSPFYDPSGKPMLPLARLYLNREKVIQRNCDEDTLQKQVTALEEVEDAGDTVRPECQTTDYTAWTPCSVSCGKGLRMRTRSYRMPEKAQMLGCSRQLISKEMCVAAIAECPGEEEDFGDFDGTALNGNEDGICKTTEWSQFSECSSDCGVGVRMRTRRFYDRMGRKKCPTVSLVEKTKCMGPPCAPGTEEIIDPTCKVTDWTDWSPCSASCGKGVKIRTRLLMVDPARQEECSTRVELLQQRTCLVQADCTFDMATAKVVCMEEADVGPCRGYFQRWAFDARKLMCVSFGYGGCRGNRNNFLTFEECTSTCGIVRAALTGQTIPEPAGLQQNRIEAPLPPPVDCMVTDWSPWTPCSVSCGPGRLTSSRFIKRHPENGGRPCPRKLQRRARCMLAPCE